MMKGKERVATAKLVKYAKELCEQEQHYRDKFKLGDVCQTVKNQFGQLAEYLECHVDLSEEVAEVSQSAGPVVSESQQVVYLYLFNAAGKQIQRWLPMLTPKNMYEYAINRPIYADKKHIETFINNKDQLDQHACIAFKVEQTDVLDQSEETLKDGLGQPLLKLAEGALRQENILSVQHANVEYQLKDGQLVLVQS